MSPSGGQNNDHSVVSVYNGDAHGPALLVCEHASNYIPTNLNQLGLPKEVLATHIAWDPGALDVAKLLSNSLNCPLVVSCVSRLVYDCNRPPEAEDAMPTRSEIYEIPGNQMLTDADKATRINLFYEPFEEKISQLLESRQELEALITIHSFTPIFHGTPREVELGILHDKDARLADKMLNSAKRLTDLTIRRNEPYGMDDGVTHTLRRHGIEKSLLNAMIEVRNDLIAVPAQCAAIASILHDVILEAFRACELVPSPLRTGA